jgi:energy-coupling factor transport system permease protein
VSTPLRLGPARPVPLSAVNPVAQLTSLAVVTVVLLVSGDLLTPLLVLAAELTLLPAAGLADPRELWRRTWPLLLSAAGVAWVNVAFGEPGRPDAWEGGAALAARVIALALPGVLLFASTDPVRLADALTLHWRVPARFAYGALAALRLVPLLATEWETIRLARRARGVDGGSNPVAACRLVVGTGFTLLVGAMRRGSRLATAMDARGFDSGIPRTNARGSVLRGRDAAFVTATVLVCAGAVAVSVSTGAWHPVFAG